MKNNKYIIANYNVIVPKSLSRDAAGRQEENRKYKSKIRELKKESEGKFKCRRCARLYAWKSSLLQHLRVEHGIDVSTKYACDFCGFIGDYQSQLLRHISVKHLKHCHNKPEAKHKCDVCGNSYLHKYTLLSHKQFACNKEPRFKK